MRGPTATETPARIQRLFAHLRTKPASPSKSRGQTAGERPCTARSPAYHDSTRNCYSCNGHRSQQAVALEIPEAKAMVRRPPPPWRSAEARLRRCCRLSPTRRDKWRGAPTPMAMVEPWWGRDPHRCSGTRGRGAGLIRYATAQQEVRTTRTTLQHERRRRARGACVHEAHRGAASAYLSERHRSILQP